MCVSFLDVRPLSQGHALVVPRDETDQWTDLPAPIATHLTEVAHAVGRAQRQIFSCERVGLLIAGFEVPHTHLHVVPLNSMANLDFATADTSPDQGVLDQTLIDLRSALLTAGHVSVSTR